MLDLNSSIFYTKYETLLKNNEVEKIIIELKSDYDNLPLSLFSTYLNYLFYTAPPKFSLKLLILILQSDINIFCKPYKEILTIAKNSKNKPLQNLASDVLAVYQRIFSYL